MKAMEVLQPQTDTILFNWILCYFNVKATHREMIPSKKIRIYTNSMNTKVLEVYI